MRFLSAASLAGLSNLVCLGLDSTKELLIGPPNLSRHFKGAVCGQWVVARNRRAVPIHRGEFDKFDRARNRVPRRLRFRTPSAALESSAFGPFPVRTLGQ